MRCSRRRPRRPLTPRRSCAVKRSGPMPSWTGPRAAFSPSGCGHLAPGPASSWRSTLNDPSCRSSRSWPATSRAPPTCRSTRRIPASGSSTSRPSLASGSASRRPRSPTGPAGSSRAPTCSCSTRSGPRSWRAPTRQGRAGRAGLLAGHVGRAGRAGLLAGRAGRTGPVAANLAYVIYTSGTTGRPKGVMTEHRHVTRFIDAFNEACGTDGDDRVYQGFSLSFDGSVEEIWMAFSNGSTLVVPTRDAPASATSSAGTSRSRPSRTSPPCPRCSPTLTADVPTLRTVVLSGEVCPPGLSIYGRGRACGC